MTETTLLTPPSVGQALRTLLRADATVLLRNRQALLLSIVLPVAILFLMQLAFGSLRVDEEDEFQGLDLSQHSESAYVLGTAGGYEPTHEVGHAAAVMRRVEA